MPRTSPRRTLAAACAVLVTLAACGEPALAPESAAPETGALFVNANGGRKGNAHFTKGGTDCVFTSATGRLACDYKIAGLGANSSGLGSLVANMQLGWDCVYSDSTRNYSREVRRVALDFLYYTDQAGNATGQVEGTAAGGAFCLTKTIEGTPQKPDPTNVRYALDAMSSPFTLPFFGAPGSWALGAVVATAKEGPEYIYYLGEWMAAEPQ